MSGDGKPNNNKKQNKKKKKKKKKSPMTAEQLAASAYVHQWAFSGDKTPNPTTTTITADDGVPVMGKKNKVERLVFELHAHSTCSDGFLSPSALVERAHSNKVKVLALTDHDTMAGIPEAMEAAQKFGIRIIPGVEISALYYAEDEKEAEEPVHILAYYGNCGPTRSEELENLLANIRDGRYHRAKEMLSKLNDLNMPLKLEHVAEIAGSGVAPGRVHVARAMVEAGHVESLKQAFARYLYDGGPAYAMGNEPSAVYVVQLINQTGGIATLAHPWSLKNPASVIRSLKAAGLHALEVYRSDGYLAGFSDLADRYNLLKLGGSDYHGRGEHEESQLGSVALPVLALYKFLHLAQPIWLTATRNILLRFAEEPTDMNLEKFISSGNISKLKACLSNDCCKSIIDLYLSSWLIEEEELEADNFEAIRLKLCETNIRNTM